MISKRRFFFSFYPPIRKESDGHPAALFLCSGRPNPFCAGRGFPDAPMVPLDFVGRDDPGAPIGSLSEGVLPPKKPSPGGRWLAEGQTDEGEPCGVVWRAGVVAPHKMKWCHGRGWEAVSAKPSPLQGEGGMAEGHDG